MNGVSNSKRQKVNLNLSDQTKSFQERIDEVRSLVEENLRYTKVLRQEKIEGSAELKSQQELQKLLQENLKVSQELYEMTKKIKHWVAWQRAWGVFKILIILVPLAIGIIYGPALIREAFAPYGELLNIGSGPANQNLLQQIQSLTNAEKNGNESR